MNSTYNSMTFLQSANNLSILIILQELLSQESRSFCATSCVRNFFFEILPRITFGWLRNSLIFLLSKITSLICQSLIFKSSMSSFMVSIRMSFRSCSGISSFIFVTIWCVPFKTDKKSSSLAASSFLYSIISFSSTWIYARYTLKQNRRFNSNVLISQ